MHKLTLNTQKLQNTWNGSQQNYKEAQTHTKGKETTSSIIGHQSTTLLGYAMRQYVEV